MIPIWNLILKPPSAGQTVVMGPLGPFWSVAESPPKFPCSFCDTPTDNLTNEKHGWHICPKPSCNRGAAAQTERIYAGLIDCPETRRDARAWAERQI